MCLDYADFIPWKNKRPASPFFHPAKPRSSVVLQLEAVRLDKAPVQIKSGYHIIKEEKVLCPDYIRGVLAVWFLRFWHFSLRNERMLPQPRLRMLKWSPADKTSSARPRIGNLGKHLEQKEACRQNQAARQWSQSLQPSELAVRETCSINSPTFSRAFPAGQWRGTIMTGFRIKRCAHLQRRGCEWERRWDKGLLFRLTVGNCGRSVGVCEASPEQLLWQKKKKK